MRAWACALFLKRGPLLSLCGCGRAFECCEGMALPSTWCWQSVIRGLPAAWLRSGIHGLALLWLLAFGPVWFIVFSTEELQQQLGADLACCLQVFFLVVSLTCLRRDAWGRSTSF
ncbi:unnamed protein product [Amoebophrya sp. A25]|nr:unnamed protein product [Amoebophrya sp. A25]|eukprot:GSA25T00015082001.1